MQRLRAVLFAGTTIIVAIGAVMGGDTPPPATDHRERALLRRPTAAVWLEADRICAVANSRSGTLSRVDVANRRVLDEARVAERIADLVRLDDFGRLLVLDDKSQELIVVRYDAAGRFMFDARTAVSSYPARVRVSPDGAEAVVVGLWSRRLDVLALRPAENTPPAETWNAAFPQVVATIALPFNPGSIAFLPDGDRLLVADAFGGNLAMVDWRRRRIAALHRLDGHNLHGMAVDAERREVVLVGQRLDSQLPATAENVRSGAFLKNRLWRIDFDRLADATPLPAEEWGVVELDQDGRGAADPTAVSMTSAGDALIALGGAAQIVVLDGDGEIRRRCDVGARPVALLSTVDEQAALVVNRLDDSLSVVDLKSGEVAKISLGPMPELYPRDRGEAAFFDARASADGRMSCHSCHTEGHTNGLTADTLGDGSYGNPKRILTLLGTSLTDPWSWNGELRELRDQVRQSLETTMHATSAGPDRYDDLVAFLHTLPFPPAPDPKPRSATDRRLLERGRDLFAHHACGNCHVGPLTYTSPVSSDVGLRDELGLKKFNPPSLRGVGQGAGFFHDNRAATLEEVLRLYRHQWPDGATDDDADALVRFLRSL
jgi:DNA-binding beta-propeller fold protein YncE